MYATSADWSFDKLPSNFGDKNSEFTNELKGMGALNFFWVQTSETSGRSITIWTDQATGQGALYRILYICTGLVCHCASVRGCLIRMFRPGRALWRLLLTSLSAFAFLLMFVAYTHTACAAHRPSCL